MAKTLEEKIKSLGNIIEGKEMTAITKDDDFIIIRERTPDDAKDTVLIKTKEGSIALGKMVEKEERFKDIILKENICLSRDKKGPKIKYFKEYIPYRYNGMYEMPKEVHEELKQKLELDWKYYTRDPNDIQEFVDTLTRTFLEQELKKMAKEELEKYFRELEETQKTDPLRYCKKINKLEKDLIKGMENCNYKNKKTIERLEQAIEIINKNVDPDRAKKALKSLKTKAYTQKFIEKDRELPKELVELARKEPEYHNTVQEELKKKTKQAIDSTEIKNTEQAQEQIGFLEYAKNCGVKTSTEEDKIIKILNGLEHITKQEHKKKLKKIRKIKEEIGPG